MDGRSPPSVVSVNDSNTVHVFCRLIVLRPYMWMSLLNMVKFWSVIDQRRDIVCSSVLHQAAVSSLLQKSCSRTVFMVPFQATLKMVCRI